MASSRSYSAAWALALALSTGAAAQTSITLPPALPGLGRAVEIKVDTRGSHPRDITAFHDKVLFVNSVDSSLWLSDGVPGATVPPSGTVRIPGPKLAIGWFAVLGGRAFFSAVDHGSSDRTLWVTDGVTASKAQIQVVFPTGSAFTELKDPEHLTRIGSRIFMSADGGEGKEPWVFDGTTARQLYDVNPNPAPNHHSNPKFFAGFPATPSSPARVVFQANNGCHGRELWFTDGTGDPLTGTRQLMDFIPGPVGTQCNRTHEGRPRFMTAVRTPTQQERVVFIATTEIPGARFHNPWVTDFTAAGTRPLQGAQLNLACTEVRHAPAFIGNGAWIVGMSPGVGFGVYYTDGTSAGTRFHRFGASNSASQSLTPVGSRHLYMASLSTSPSGSAYLTTRFPMSGGPGLQFPVIGTAGSNKDPASNVKPYAVAGGKVFMASVGQTPHLWVIDNGATAQPEAWGCSGRSWLEADDPLWFNPLVFVKGSTTIPSPSTVVVVGVPRAWPSGSPAPVLPRFSRLGGCELHLIPITATPPSARQHFSAGFPIPMNPSLLGQSLMCQALITSGNPSVPSELTNPVRMTIGDF